MLRRITKHSEYREFSSPDLFLRSDNFYAAALFDSNAFALGITIGRKTGKAHTRNLLKRRIKAWARLRYTALPQGCKLNLIARPSAGELGWNDLCAELDKLSAQLRARC